MTRPTSGIRQPQAIDESFMRLALEACQQGIQRSQSPFGACIVRDGQVLAVAHNHVWHDTDPSAHAEIVCIRQACRRTRSVHLEGATIYSTTEPCPMCFSCIHWTRISRIVYAANIQDAASYGFNELPVSNVTMKQASGSAVELVASVLRDQALALFEEWRKQGGKAY
jgi:tRNA(Arg) A34 adenosine deaminase TadA